MSSRGATNTDAHLRAEVTRLKRAVEALEAVIRNRGGEVTIGNGQRGITIKKDGDITINGKNVDTIASGRASIKASKDVVIKGKKILEN